MSDVTTKNETAVPWMAIIICVTGVVVFIFGCATYLLARGSNLEDFRGLIGTLANIVTLFFTGGGLLYAGAAKKQADKAVEQTNGSLDARLHAVVSKVVSDHADSIRGS